MGAPDAAARGGRSGIAGKVSMGRLVVVGTAQEQGAALTKMLSDSRDNESDSGCAEYLIRIAHPIDAEHVYEP